MTRFISALALIAGVVACVPLARAVNLNSNGTGQVLIYPYYTVNAGQQTQISVVNTTLVGKVVKVRFREAYNGRAVLDFNLYLSPYDVWTANVFALSDAGAGSDYAGIFSADRSCTDPPLTGSGTLAGGQGYQRFSNVNYTGAAADTGPGTDARTREGHVEMILMSDVAPGSELYHDIHHVNSAPPDCTPAHIERAAGYVAPTLDPVTGAPGTLADGGLFGAAAVVDVAQGVFYAYNADALDGFSYVSLNAPLGDNEPTLDSANDRDNVHTATARMVVSGEQLASTFPGAAPGSRKVDAVSAVFAANNLYNEYLSAPDRGMSTDWVLTLPTKHLYVDAQPGGAIAGAPTAFDPFEQRFGEFVPGAACFSTDPSAVMTMDREENTTTTAGCGFSAGCPPLPPVRRLCLETNVLAFSANSILGSQLPLEAAGAVASAGLGGAGWVNWDLGQSRHQLYAAGNGNVFHGVPVTGFAATRYVNDYVPLAGGVLGVANYSAAYRHRITAVCTNGAGACL